MNICTVEGCTVQCRNGTSPYCEKHYTRWKRHGDPSVALKDHTPASERWKTSYEVDDHTDCWVWTGPYDGNGYGTISEGAKKRHMAHIFVYRQLAGPVTAGMELDHKCRNRACVNPKHLEPVPHRINVQRGDAGIVNAGKTHCKYGHEFTPANTIIRKDKGWRQCRTCCRVANREAQRKRRAEERLSQPERAYCKHGHVLSPDNLYIGHDGARLCITCARIGGGKRRRVVT